MPDPHGMEQGTATDTAPVVVEMPQPEPRPRSRAYWVFFSFLVPALILFAVGWNFLGLKQFFFSSVSELAVLPPLQGQADGRTNILIMGMTLDGNRTDSLILASYYYKENKLVTLNIPRDLYMDDGLEKDKIVSLYAYAKNRKPGDPSYPPQVVSDFISKEYGIPIQYWVVANMDGFKQVIDRLGGIDVTVERSFTDHLYPTDDYSGYMRPAPNFTAGLQHMDGTEALIFARSRHSTDPLEGTDFARSHRQSLVIDAVLEKIKSRGLLANVWDLQNYYDIFKQDISTNMHVSEMASLARIVKQLDPSTEYLKAEWSNTIGFLCDSQTSGGAYILLYGSVNDCGTPAGGQQTSPARDEAISFVQNLLQATDKQTVLSSKVAIISDDENDAVREYDALGQLGFDNVSYTGRAKNALIDPSAGFPYTIYISDPALRNAFERSGLSMASNVQVKDLSSVMANIPSSFSGAQIVIFIPSSGTSGKG